MQRNYTKKYVSNSEKDAANKEFIFQHMSSHYRRIINAKKIVDTSPPSCYKPKRSKNSILGSTESIRSSKSKHNFSSRNISPELTQRSVSTNSYKGSSWGTESGVSSSRYHSGCVPQTIKTHAGTKYVCFDMGLVDLITYDTKNSPEVYCNGGWAEIKAQHNDLRFKSPTKENKEKSTVQPGKHLKAGYQSKRNEFKQNHKFSVQEKELPKDLTVKPTKLFTGTNSNNKERRSQTIATSKLRSSHVYHPPRKKPNGIPHKSSPEISIANSPKTPEEKSSNARDCAALDTNIKYQKNINSGKEQSQTSSRDSAYNGGISSLPESRSPTPDQRLIEEKYFVQEDPYIHRNKSNHQSSDKINEEKKAENITQKNDKVFLASLDTLDCNVQNEEALKKMKEDGLYIKFIQDITMEILEKCLYTNKSLKKVMRRHIVANLENLNKERMIKEVENLRIQLGIPEDKGIFDVEKEVIDSLSDLPPTYSFISDSEFILPEDVKVLQSIDFNHIMSTETVAVDAEISKSTINHVTSGNSYEGQHQTHQAVEEKNRESLTLGSGCEEYEELLSYIEDITTNKKKSSDDSVGVTSSSDESIKSPLNTKRTKLRGKNAKERKISSSSTTFSEIEENILEVELPDETGCEYEEEAEVPFENFQLKGTVGESLNTNICRCANLKKHKDPCNNCVQVQENITFHKVRATYETTVKKTSPK